uniref:Uncharacterized protein n=1 Tax=Anguilla anguilla TaxID=7936 RepID=A0A0E9XVC6_ANGAN
MTALQRQLLKCYIQSVLLFLSTCLYSLNYR